MEEELLNLGGAGHKSPDAGVPGVNDEGFVHDLKLVAVEAQQLQSTICKRIGECI